MNILTLSRQLVVLVQRRKCETVKRAQRARLSIRCRHDMSTLSLFNPRWIKMSNTKPCASAHFPTWRHASMVLLTCAAACSGSPNATSSQALTADGPTVDASTAVTYALSVDVPFSELTIPDHVRSGDGIPPAKIPLRNWRQQNKSHVTRLPIRTRNLYFHRPSPGMVVRNAAGEEVPHRSMAPAAPVTWTYDARSLMIHGHAGAIGPSDYTFSYPKATEREARLNRLTARIADDGSMSREPDAEAFVRTRIQVGAESRSGLLLPAPSVAAWTLDPIPPAADLHVEIGLVEPEVFDGEAGDGASGRLTLDVNGETHELWSGPITSGAFTPHTIGLDAYGGQQGTLRFEADPGASTLYDYVFLADPVVASRSKNPKRVVLVFIDTLRFDHLGMYGYERDTSPALDKLASRGIRFDEARNVAPWTLPSTRSAVTGRHPEYFFDSPTLQGMLRAEGFATAMFAGNLYLGPNFGLHRDWGLHHVELLPHAVDQVDKAIAWLEDHAGRDSLLLLHLMDPHLPYKEPKAYRNRWTDTRPAGLKKEVFHRADVVRAKLRTPEERQYVRDRYDQNIRYTDDQLARLFERLSPQDTVVVFSDHGEEFWDHNGFEHGHTLYDELLHVPLIITSPDLKPGAVTAPVSLLDVVPTVLDLMDVTTDARFDGQSLVPVMSGEPGAAETLQQRDQAFGRPLYGKERWGVLHGTTKYMTHEGRQQAYDLAADPGERQNQLAGEGPRAQEMRGWLGSALGRPVDIALRLSSAGVRTPPTEDLIAELTLPGGIASAWVGEDPTRGSLATIETLDASSIVVRWPRGYRGSRDVWIVPTQTLPEATSSAVLRAWSSAGGEASATVTGPRDKATSLGKGAKRILTAKPPTGRSVSLSLAITPAFDADAGSLDATDPENTAALQAMGYLEEDE